MKSFDYYKDPGMARPFKRNYTTVYVYDRGQCIGTYTPETYSEERPNLPKDHVKQEVVDEEAFKKDMNEYQRLSRQKEHEFKEDLKEEFGVLDNPKAERAFALAWEKGHSAGLEDVYSKFDDFVELIE